MKGDLSVKAVSGMVSDPLTWDIFSEIKYNMKHNA